MKSEASYVCARILENAAMIAEGEWQPESNALSQEYILRHKIAEDIRAYSRKLQNEI